jgi:hypothetical protein
MKSTLIILTLLISVQMQCQKPLTIKEQKGFAITMTGVFAATLFLSFLPNEQGLIVPKIVFPLTTGLFTLSQWSKYRKRIHKKRIK